MMSRETSRQIQFDHEVISHIADEAGVTHDEARRALHVIRKHEESLREERRRRNYVMNRNSDPAEKIADAIDDLTDLDRIRSGSWDNYDENGKWHSAVAVPAGWYIDKDGNLRQAQ
jgi:hypothetical protein